MKWLLKQHFQIESARSLPLLPKGHPCAQVHGHSFKIILSLIGGLDAKVGWVIDYNEIHQIMNPILKVLDHRLLNEVPGLENPTSEIIAQWIYDKAKPLLPQLTQICIMETSQTECHYPA